LVAQREDLELEGGPRSESCTERGEDGEEDFLHERSKLRNLGGTTSGLLVLVHTQRNSRDVGQFDIFGTHRPVTGPPFAWVSSPVSTARVIRPSMVFR
jgi:hypothetical protein